MCPRRPLRAGCAFALGTPWQAPGRGGGRDLGEISARSRRSLDSLGARDGGGARAVARSADASVRVVVVVVVVVRVGDEGERHAHHQRVREGVVVVGLRARGGGRSLAEVYTGESWPRHAGERCSGDVRQIVEIVGRPDGWRVRGRIWGDVRRCGEVWGR